MRTSLEKTIESSALAPGIAINPKFKALIPKLSPKEFSQLEANLLADGCRDPMVTWNGTLLDGHNRLEICERHKLPFKTVEVEMTDENAAQVWIIRNQFGRRNITLACRCELAEKLAEALKPKAKDNQKAGGGDRKSSRAKSGLPILAEPINTREQAAKEAGVSHGSLTAFKFLKENASPEVLAELMHNPEVKLHRIAKELLREIKIDEHGKKLAAIAACPQPLVDSGPKDIILADPPWQYDFAETDSRKIENQYPTQTVDDICAMQIPRGENGLLLLWATAPKLLEAIRVMAAWGYEYKTHAVWDKEKQGMGYWFRGQHEILLVGVRGTFSPPMESLRCGSVFREPRGKHSKKPECVYQWIETAFPEFTKHEMYCRKPRQGWTCSGNEARTPEATA